MFFYFYNKFIQCICIALPTATDDFHEFKPNLHNPKPQCLLCEGVHTPTSVFLFHTRTLNAPQTLSSILSLRCTFSAPLRLIVAPSEALFHFTRGRTRGPSVSKIKSCFITVLASQHRNLGQRAFLQNNLQAYVVVFWMFLVFAVSSWDPAIDFFCFYLETRRPFFARLWTNTLLWWASSCSMM